METFLKIAVSIVTLVFGTGIFWKIREKSTKRESEKGAKTKNLKLKDRKLIERVEIAVGSFAEIYYGNSVAYRITCLQLTKVGIPRDVGQGENEKLVAEIEFEYSGELFYPSKQVVQSGTNRFLMPVNKYLHSIVYRLYHSRDKVHSFMAYVTHIDTKEEIVYMQLAIDD